MENKITIEQLKELLEIQKEFDKCLPTLNSEDSKISFIVEFFKWFKTLETFKSWKKIRGKSSNVQLNALVDMLSCTLSAANQNKFDTNDYQLFIELWELETFLDADYLANKKMIYDMMEEFCDDFPCIRRIIIVFKIAEQLYSIPQLTTAYKKKMLPNQER